jgi:glycosyltransferase involved in cell wall biosynthesis
MVAKCFRGKKKSKYFTKMKCQLVSVIIPVYNRSEVVCETLNSLLAQTYANWECIIVDDGSTDNTIAVLKEYQDKDTRFKVFSRGSAYLKGPSSCRNIGITKAIGDYLMFLDSDDLLDASALQNRVSYFNQYDNEDGLIFTTQMFDLDISNKKEVFNIDPEIQSKYNYLALFLNQKYAWTVMSGIWKKSVFERVQFNDTLVLLEDVVFHIDILFLKDISIKRIHLIDNFYRRPAIYKRDNTHKYLNIYSSFYFIFEKYEALIKAEMLLQTSFSKFYKRVYLSILIENISYFKKKELLNKIKSSCFISFQEKLLLNIISFLYRYKLNHVKGFGIYTIIKFLETKAKIQ